MKYNFPFEACRASGHKKVCIFGAGFKGLRFQRQLLDAGDIANKAFIDNFITADKACETINAVGVYKPQEFKDQIIDFDCIVLACDYHLIPQLCADLFSIGICSSKIVLPKLDVTQKLDVAHSLTPNTGESWDSYYDEAEATAHNVYERHFVPVLDKYPISFRHTLDFACGRGRIAEQVYLHNKNGIEKIICCDSNQLAIDYCRTRFADSDKFDFLVNEADEMHTVPLKFPDECFSFIFSWNAMVHFSYKWLDFYIGEFWRMLQSGGYAFIHHSNLGSPSVYDGQAKHETWNMNPGSRTLVSSVDVQRIAEKNGFVVVDQKIIDWHVKDLDCLSILRKI